MRALALLVPVLLFAPLASAQEEEHPEQREAPPGYDHLIEQALEESSAGRWEESRVLFRRAHELYPNARTLRGIGMVAFELRDYPDAIRNLRRALEATERPLTADQRAHAEQLIGDALAYVGTYELSNVPEGAEIFVDGAAAVPERDGTLLLRVGPHEVVVRTESDTWEGRFTVRGGEREPIPIEFERLEARERVVVQVIERAPPDPTPAWALTIGGASVAIAGLIVFLAGVADWAAVQNAQPGTPWDDLEGAYDRAPILTSIGGVVLGLGGAAAIGGGIWLGMMPSGEAPRASISLRGRF